MQTGKNHLEAVADPLPAGVAQASALAHPSRQRIALLLAESPDGLSAAEIAAGVGLHHNVVREHLRTLAGAGVVASERERPTGRGRPSERYMLIDDTAPRAAAHQELVRLLVGLLLEAGMTEDRAEAFGRSQGAGLMAQGTAGRGAILSGLARLGFAPREVASAAEAADGILDARLEHCPFREAVLAPGGEVICALHAGLLAGMASTSGPQARLTEFVAKDPRMAGCVVRLEGVPDPPATRRTGA